MAYDLIDNPEKAILHSSAEAKMKSIRDEYMREHKCPEGTGIFFSNDTDLTQL